ncbi:type II toxin-antitoxin system PemK/MazF family toxin [Paenarthrobacter sp. NPDC056912]|uniref:type II toxin-antitoxin system PemK/MazF family toxin n=1 Tax=Paenarthrobacter sp. NPDC056912 TaxID=3345965 RepID=UPI00366FB2D1
MALDLRPLGKLILRSLKALGGSSTKAASPSGTRTQQTRRPGVGLQPGAYPGDFRGTAKLHYSPKPDGLPDPGEIVWSWVPYEEDHSQGKDRPVLLVGRDGKWLLGLMLTSKDHNNGSRADDYVDIGAGPWDRQGRPSEVKVDRVIRLDPQGVRREGAVLGKKQFQDVSKAVRARHGWT